MAEQKAAEFSTPYQFNAKELDKESGLYNYGARYYDPSLSIWTGVDPLADKAPGWTPYRYGLNNPVRMIDPDGRFETEAEAQRFQEENNITGGIYQDNGAFFIQGTGDHDGQQYAYGAGGAGFEGNNSSFVESAVNFAGLGATIANDYYNDMGSFRPNGKTQVPIVESYTAKNGKTYLPSQHPNGATGPRASWKPNVTLSESTSILPNTAKKYGMKATKFGGGALSLLSAGMTIDQYDSGKISSTMMIAELSMTGVSSIPNPYTIAAGVGWELGRVITNIPAYRRRVHPYEFSPITIPNK